MKTFARISDSETVEGGDALVWAQAPAESAIATEPTALRPLVRDARSTVSRRHLVIIGKYYPPHFGGIERYVSDLAHQAADRFRVTVVVHSRTASDSIEQEGRVTVIRCGTVATIGSQPISPSMFGHLRRLDPDIIHFNAPNFWAAAALLAGRKRAPVVITHHADVVGRKLLKKLALPLYRRLIGRADGVVVNSLRNIENSADLPKSAPSPVAIPWGVDERAYELDELTLGAIRLERVRRFGHAPVIGFVGRFVRYKGLPVLVEAMRALPDAHLVLIGDGPLRASVEEQVRAAGLADRIHFRGLLDEETKIREIGMMDVLVLPSIDATEAFGVVQVEAQLMGLPVVATELGTGVTDVTVDGETGLVVPPGDPAALAAAMQRLVTDREYARRLGHAGRHRALANFTLTSFGRRFADLFEAIAEATSRN